MANNELELWWSSLTVTQKERVAMKGISKAEGGRKVEEAEVSYPACTTWWNSLEQDQRQRIHDHCVDRHGYLLKEWNDADPYGD